MADTVETEWADCWNCGGEGWLQDTCTCMDDTCCCAEPDPQTCGHCGGAGGYQVPAGSGDEEAA